MTARTLCVAAAVALLLGPPPGAAQGIAEPWRGRLSEIERARRDGRYQAVETAAADLALEMAQRLPAGETGRRTLALTLTYHALAAVLLKRQDDALWSWHIAQNLNPALRTEPIPASWGDAGAWLAAHRLRRPGVFDGAVDAPVGTAEPSVAPPGGGNRERLADGLEVEAVVDPEGRVHSPVVVAGGDSPGKVYSALSSLRQKRFEPAIEDGRPVAAILKLSIPAETEARVDASRPAAGGIE
jgi:Gram-negative bacterial TonB protein C-terminal